MRLLFAFIVACCLILTVSGFKPTSAKQIELFSGNSTACTICQFIVNIAEGYVENNSTEQEILKELEFSCDLLGVPSWVSECKGLISDYGEMIIQYLINDETPYVVCQQIGFCNSSAILYEAIPLSKTPNSDDESDNLECVFCDWAIAKLDDILSNQNTQSEALSFLENECQLLGNAKWVYDCKTLISEYGPIVIAMLANNEPSDKVCSTVLNCPSSLINVPSSQVVLN
eukprot:TRINITY_DN259_c0_g2_i1.p1 TRINITY_DN259_c0_g2~~TRINITY_DN259_c0_g2_i1.p1  ORF type:complete len:261 (+),score=57.76 TRINITY_DN259_c0_g2_i1:99-785(+)